MLCAILVWGRKEIRSLSLSVRPMIDWEMHRLVYVFVCSQYAAARMDSRSTLCVSGSTDDLWPIKAPRESPQALCGRTREREREIVNLFLFSPCTSCFPPSAFALSASQLQREPTVASRSRARVWLPGRRARFIQPLVCRQLAGTAVWRAPLDGTAHARCRQRSADGRTDDSLS